jgi:(p)ppGpp synthase/HD superfamily hydrolase
MNYLEYDLSVHYTIRLVTELHEGQTDKVGVTYWPHPLRVMLRLPAQAQPVARHAALAHDFFEDCGVGPIYMARKGYGPEFIHAVNLLTHEIGRTRRGYRDRLLQSGNLTALLVKLADVYDNSAPGRINRVEESLRQDLAEKYGDLAGRLEAAIQKLAPGTSLPFKGDPVPGTLLADFWPPYVENLSGAGVDFILGCKLHQAIKSGRIA